MPRIKTGAGDGTIKKHKMLHGMLTLVINASKTGKQLRNGTKKPPIAYNIFDTHSGQGNYVLKGKKYIGSPLQLLDAIYRIKAPKTKKALGLPQPVRLYSSDIDAIKVQDLRSNMALYEFDLRKELDYHGHTANWWCHQRTANETIEYVLSQATQKPSELFILWIDPNALMDAPIDKIRDLVSQDRKNIVLFVNISTMAIKRSLASFVVTKNKTNSKLLEMLASKGYDGKKDTTVDVLLKEIFGEHWGKVFINEDSMGDYKFHVACRIRDFYRVDNSKNKLTWGDVKRAKDIEWAK